MIAAFVTNKKQMIAAFVTNKKQMDKMQNSMLSLWAQFSYRSILWGIWLYGEDPDG